ncbi:MAG TPA: hypothetical protein VFD97_03155 [Acidimicrobiia bacterium]|nr:hypothetical protein [Acidimicrobiia bacterium]
MTEEHADEDLLRIRYFDWCSAKVAERFLSLPEEEVWELAQRARASTVRYPASDPPSALPTGSASYWELVRQVAKTLATEMGLPAYEEWVEQYRIDPGRFDRDILGFPAYSSSTGDD